MEEDKRSLRKKYIVKIAEIQRNTNVLQTVGERVEIGEVMKAKEKTRGRESERMIEVQRQMESLSLIECFVVVELSHNVKLAVHNSWL